jgi:hypothetical protein
LYNNKKHRKKICQKQKTKHASANIVQKCKITKVTKIKQTSLNVTNKTPPNWRYFLFVFIKKYVTISLVHRVFLGWGVETRSLASNKIWRVALFFVADERTPDIPVRRVANILNKHTIPMIVSNLLTTFFVNGGFCLQWGEEFKCGRLQYF